MTVQAVIAPWTPIPNGIWGALRHTIRPYVGAEFTVDGEPVPKGRPRLGQGRTYTPKRTTAAEKKVRAAFKQAMPGWDPEPDLTYGALVEFRTGSGSVVDIDNATKLIMDALNKVFYLDDIQVGDEFLHLVRGRGEPGVEVWLFAVEANGTKPTRLCECGTRYRSDQKVCADCRKRRAIVNALLADDSTAAQAAEALDRDRRRVFSYVIACSIGTNVSPSVAKIAAGAGITTTRAGAVLATLISDGYMTRDDRKLKIVKPLGVAA
jgi:Holliday junction resolvase RusA-like endonuclease